MMPENLGAQQSHHTAKDPVPRRQLSAGLTAQGHPSSPVLPGATFQTPPQSYVYAGNSNITNCQG
jgi:hypothetical protein